MAKEVKDVTQAKVVSKVNWSDLWKKLSDNLQGDVDRVASQMKFQYSHELVYRHATFLAVIGHMEAIVAEVTAKDKDAAVDHEELWKKVHSNIDADAKRISSQMKFQPSNENMHRHAALLAVEGHMEVLEQASQNEPQAQAVGTH